MLPPSFRNSEQMRNKITKNTSAIDDSCACSPFFSSVEDPYSICCNPLNLALYHALFFFPAGFPTHIITIFLLNRCLNHGILSHKRSKKLLDIVTERKRKQRTGGVTGGSSSSSKQKQISPTPPKKKKTKVKKEESVLRSVDI